LNDKRLSGSRAALTAVALGLLSSLGPLSATANESDEEPAVALKYSVTPFAGYRFGGKFGIADTNARVDAHDHVSYGVALDLATDEQTQYELFYSRQSTSLGPASPAPSDTVIEYLHLGGTLTMGESQRFQPYIIGTLGVTRFSPDSPIGRDRIYFSLSLGAGLRVPLNNHLALRLEMRGFATFFNTNSTVFCRSDQSGGVCQIHGSGSAFFQGDALAALAYTF
jgi:hypothetical protein